LACTDIHGFVPAEEIGNSILAIFVTARTVGFEDAYERNVEELC
jgi:hypothetical protein